MIASLSSMSNSEVLDLVDEYRLGRFRGRGDPRNRDFDPMLCKLLIGEAMCRGIYPATPQAEYPDNPNSTFTMAECWGANWIEWREPLACPLCAADLRDRRVGPPFKREIGIYDQRKDMTVEWQCPDCKQNWPRRFPE